MSMIECKKLSIGYDKKVVCKDINFEINEGEYLCILGENGSGKSTLLKTILGLNKPVFGKIILNKTISKNKLGYLPQQTDFQRDFPATVWEVVMSGFVSSMGLRPFYNKAEKSKAQEILDFLGLSKFAKNGFKELSGGQQQRVLLARALCATDKVLVLDEPTNGLDAKATAQFYKLLKTLNEKGLTIVMVSHNIERVLEYATNIVYLKDSMIFSGTIDDFRGSDIMSALKIGE